MPIMDIAPKSCLGIHAALCLQQYRRRRDGRTLFLAATPRELQRAAATARTAGGTYIQTRAEGVESEGLRDRTREGQHGTGD